MVLKENTIVEGKGSMWQVPEVEYESRGDAQWGVAGGDPQGNLYVELLVG